jgi:TP901 family phage tail tape measure protein
MAKAGAARVFFDIVGQLQSEKLLGDTKAAMVIQEAIVIDTLGGIADAFADSTQYILDGVQHVIDAFFEYEQQFVRVRKFYQGTATEAREFADAAMEMGHAFAFTGAESLAAAARTAQLKNVLGGQLAVIEATRAGLLMAQVGEMETELGMNRFIALAQQTQFMYGGLTKAQYEALDAEQQANLVRETSIHTLNQLNTIENTSVATMEDITFVLNQFASQANIAGESIGEMAAMSALLLETGEEVSRAGTGLRMIYQRLGNANNEATKAIAEMVPGLDAQGVAQMKLSDVIKAISPAYDEMDAAQKRALAVSIAGSRHYIKFLKIMENQDRLIQMQTDSFHALYPAIEEFENKTESSVFKATQMEAKLNDMKVMLGEKLAPAYMSSYRAQEFFLKGVETFLDLPGAEKAVGGLIAASNIYKETLQPLSELALRFAGLSIAMKTFSAAQPEQIANSRRMASQFHNLADARLSEQMLGDANIESLRKETIGINRAQQSILGKTSARKRGLTADRVALNVKRRANKAQADTIIKNIMEAESGGKAGKALKQLHWQKGKLVKTNDRLARQQGQLLTLQRLAKRDHEFELKISSMISAQKKGREIIDKRTLLTMYQNVQAQTQMNAGLTNHATLMSNEIVLTAELDKRMVKQLEHRSMELLLLQEDARARMAALNAERAELLSKGQSTVAIDEKIAAEREEIMTLGQKRSAIQGTIMANNQYIASSKAAAGGVKGLTANLKLGATAFFEQGKAAQAAKGGIMAMTMLLPMIVHEEEQMAAMTYSAGIMMISMLVPAIMSVNAGLIEMGVAAGIASGGLTILIGGLAALAVYAGFEIFSETIGGDIESQIGLVDELNTSLDTTASILAELQGPSGESAILPGLIDISYNDLKQNADLTTETYTDVISRIEGLKKNQLAAEKSGDDDLANMYANRISEMEVIESKIKSIGDAQKLVNGEMKIASDERKHQLTIEEELLKGVYDFPYKQFTVGYDIDGDGKVDEEVKKITDLYGYIDSDGFTDEYYKAQQEAYEAYLKEKESLTIDYSTDDHQFMVDYYTTLLTVQEDANEEMIEAERQMYDALSQETEEFANAREELFFGERANFTGQIFKNITQGGVESILHRVEFIQTNNFNGMVLDEMVEQVSTGVVQELRSLGVPI